MFRASECWGGKPEEVEVTPTCVLVRKDFEQVEQVEDGQPTGVTGWAYQEARMSAGEYAAYAADEARSGLLDVQEAVAEMYEALIGD